MRIISVFQGSFPDGGPMTKRLHLYCKGQIEEGNDAMIIIPHASEAYRDHKTPDNTYGVYDTVKFKYLSKSTIRSNNFLARRILDFIGSIKLCIYLLKQKNNIDIILLVDIRNILPIILCLISRFIGAKIVYELNEHPTVLHGKFQFYFNKIFFYPFLHGFVVINNPLKQLVESFNNKNTRSIVIPVLVGDLPNFDESTKLSKLKSPYILHTGSLIDEKDGFIGMLRALELVNSELTQPLNLYSTGILAKSPDAIKISSTIKKFNLEKYVTFLGRLEEQVLRIYQKNSSIFIINKPDTFRNHYCSPTKLGEYFLSGNPVVITKVGEITAELIDNHNVYVVNADKPSELAHMILFIRNNQERAKIVGKNGRILAETYFSYKTYSKNLHIFFDSLTQST